jgi:hypothetical protein
MLLAAVIAGCSAANVNGVDATGDRVPIVRNCGTWIVGIRVLDAESRRVLWAASEHPEGSGSRHGVAEIAVGRLPDSSWAEETPLALSPRPVRWSFEIDSGRVETLTLLDGEIHPGFVARPGRGSTTAAYFRDTTCGHGGSGLGLVGGLAIAAFFVVWAGGFALWIVKLVQVARIPEFQYRAAGTDKTTWILVVVLTSFIGALIWQFGPRRRVLNAAGSPPTPPGWYITSTGVLRWWNGNSWTDAVHTPPPPPNPPQP